MVKKEYNEDGTNLFIKKFVPFFVNAERFLSKHGGIYMTTYKVLLVDDEEEVRNAIEQRINWEELGFEVIGKAQNGVKAMEIAEKLQPDVVITDIKMPYMNGLELARNLKEENPGVRILILTGFDEFEYAKEAVHLEIEEYILKPINANELSECLKRLKNVLDKEREKK